jgi:RimJ/RimL family protein N-acetyltransferase
MILHGHIVVLRPFDRRHAELTRTWINDLELACLLDRAFPVADAEHDDWYRQLASRRDAVYFAIESLPAQGHVGNVWLWNIDARHRHAEVRIVIGDTREHGRGCGTEALRLIARYARERLNLRRLYAYTLATNPRARRAFEKAGFALEGVLREDRWVGDCYADVHLLGTLLEATTNGSSPC